MLHYIQFIAFTFAVISTPCVLTGATITLTSRAFLAFVYICNIMEYIDVTTLCNAHCLKDLEGMNG